jgi:hypothetical protein
MPKSEVARRVLMMGEVGAKEAVMDSASSLEAFGIEGRGGVQAI